MSYVSLEYKNLYKRVKEYITCWSFY